MCMYEYTDMCAYFGYKHCKEQHLLVMELSWSNYSTNKQIFFYLIKSKKILGHYSYTSTPNIG